MTAWREVRQELVPCSFGGDYWQFSVSPEAGIIFPMGQTYLTAKVKYMNGFKTSTAPTLSYLGIGLGFAW